MSQPTWASEIPRYKGWYWYSDGEGLSMVEAVDYGATLKSGAPRFWIKGRTRYFWADDFQAAYGGKWLGPVRAPELPERDG